MWLHGWRDTDVSHLAEAALVLVVRGSVRTFAVLCLGFFGVVVLKPAQDKVAEDQGQQQNAEPLQSCFPHPSKCCRGPPEVGRIIIRKKQNKTGNLCRLDPHTVAVR